MVPALIETLADLPRLPSGKLDRSALPAPRSYEREPSQAKRSPRTDTERRIANVWRELFRHQAVSVDDDFFLDLGGHSLLAARKARSSANLSNSRPLSPPSRTCWKSATAEQWQMNRPWAQGGSKAAG